MPDVSGSRMERAVKRASMAPSAPGDDETSHLWKMRSHLTLQTSS